MNTRKASLRKLRLPGATTNKSRNGHQKNAATISNYFSCEEDSEGLSKNVQMTLYSTTTPSTIAEIDETAVPEETPSPKENPVEPTNDVDATMYSGRMPSPIEAQDQEANKLKRALRTKLSTFLPKENRVKTGKRNTNDFERPNKIVKKAPKAKAKASSKKQQSIKSALLKHEQLFSEVTAQHCLADNVNPDEMQMAIALSRSELEISMSAEEVQDEDKANVKNEGIRDKLKKFGFRVAESEDYNLTAFMPTKRKKTKWANKFTALTLRNPQRQLSKINQKIENLLSSQFASEDLQPVDDSTSYSLKSRVLVRFLANDHHVVRTNVSEAATLVDFYVLSLFEPSRTKAGHLLKDVSLIAGRDATPKKVNIASQDAENEALFQSPAMKKSRCDKEISSSCPSLNRNLLDVFDCVSTQPEYIKESSFSENRVEALREITSISLNTVGNKNESDKQASACEISCTTSTKAFSDECLNVSAEIGMSTELETVSSPVRCTSPDIFADSDSDIATDECADNGGKLNASKSSPSDHHITTYEMFSSDEVKTFSITSKDSNIMLSPTPVIDLTQCGSDSNTQPSPKDVPKVEEYKESASNSFYTALINLDEGDKNGFEPSKSMERSLHQSLQNSIGVSFGSSRSEDFDKSNSMKTKASEISIDLTQNEDDEDDCILLSDDEVNYSIWQANKTDHMQEHQPNDYVSINGSQCSRNENEFENREFSFIELATGSQPLPRTQSEEIYKGVHLESNNFLDLELDLDQSRRPDVGILEQEPPFKTPTKTPTTSPRTTPTSKSPNGQKLLSEWLISSRETTPKHCSGMQSTTEDAQALFKTPTKTPKNKLRKTSTSVSPKCRKTLSDSFKTSPAERGNTSGRCLSANSLHDNSQLDLDYSKRSDFGILDEQSPFKTPTQTPRKTPRKTPDSASPRCRKKLSESFILSPGERVPPIKRFSSLNNFKEFIKIDDDDDNLSDLDEIDKIIYGSPSKRAYKKPAGLDQLLTGPINTQIESPQKSEPDSPKEFSFNGRTYLVRSSNVSQMLDYENMDESALLNELYKNGIRRLKRKQAIKVLEYIYKQTHPCLVETNESPTRSTQDRSEDEENFSNEHPIDEASTGCKFNLKDCWGHLLVSNADSQMEIKDEQYIFPTNTSKKISTVSLPFHIAWYNLVKSNKLLHEAILHYEPIDLQDVYMFLKSLGYRYDPKELKCFLDSRSIIFRYDLNKTDPSAASKRHTRKRPHMSTQRKGLTKRS